MPANNYPPRPDEPDFDGRLRKTLLLQGEPDRVPLMEALVEPEVIAQFLGRPPVTLEDKVEFYYTAGYDYVPMEVGLLGVGKTVAEDSMTVEAAYGLFGAHRARTWAAEDKGIITTQDDFERFPWPAVDDLDWGPLEQIERLLPKGMKVIVTAGKIYTPVWEWMGATHFFYALTDDVDLVDRMFDRVGSIQYATFERALTYPVVAGFWTADDIAYVKGPLVHPKYLRRWYFPWYKRMAQVCHARGIPFLFHSDGKLEAIMTDILDTGWNAAHPFEPKCNDIAAVKRQYGDRLCLIGNLDLGYTLTRGTPEEVEAEVRQRIHDCAPGGGYCVASSNSVTEYVPIANYNAMRAATFKYGRYPITV
jgi:uroporphyrinogen decarboxylase